MHHDQISVDAIAGLMGNHLIDSKAPELNDPDDVFTHTCIFGANDGRVTFYEMMLTRDSLPSGPSGCFAIKQPSAWQVVGWYPANY